MIGLIKQPFKGKERVRRARFDSFSQKLDGERNLRPASCTNCDFRGGVLRGGVGLKKCVDEKGNDLVVTMNVTTTAPHVFFTTLNSDGEQDNTTAIYVVSTDGYLYLRRNNGIGLQRVYMGQYVEHSVLKVEDKRIYNFFCSDSHAYGTVDGSTFNGIIAVDNVGACICGKRYLVLSVNGELIYTAAFAPYEEDNENPDGAGRIYLPAKYGAPTGIKAYGESAYIFFEKGICKLTLSANAKENTLKEVPYHGGNICLRAQAVTSEGIIFLAREGAYYLRNDRVERICEYLPIGPCVPTKNSSIGYCDDMVIFAYYKENGQSSTIQRVAIYADGKDGYIADVYGNLSGNEYGYLYGRIYRYERDGQGVQHGRSIIFTTKPLDFGTSKKKRLKTLLLKGEGGVSVYVRSGNKERGYTLVFENGVAKARLFDKGEDFSFTFYLDAGASIQSMEVEYLTEV